MPTYDYRCGACGDFEAFHGMKDASLAACPTCGGPVTRMISKGGGLIFKGSGFYSTDYRSADYKQRAEKEAGMAKPASAEPAKPAAGDVAKPASGAGTTAASPASPAGGSSSPAAGSASSGSGGSTGPSTGGGGGATT